jgi:hypothetical protein
MLRSSPAAVVLLGLSAAALAAGERIAIPLDDVTPEVDQPVVDERGIVTTIASDGTLRMALPTANGCTSATSGEIIVCAERSNADADAPPPVPSEDANPIEIRLSENATVTPSISSRGLPMGGSDVAALVTLKVEF